MANRNPSSAVVVDYPPEKQPIDILPDLLLADVFGYLSPSERLKAAEVCRKWIAIVRLSWLKTKCLDVSQIPTPRIGAVLSLCPRLEKIIAHDKKVNLDNINDYLRDSNLRAIAFFNVKLAVGPDGVNNPEVLQSTFKDSLVCFVRNIRQLESFTWHNVCPTSFDYTTISYPGPWWSIVGFFFQVGILSALTRLQLTGGPELDASHLFASLRRLTNLECLALGGVHKFNAVTGPRRTFKWAVAPLEKLRELMIVDLVIHRAGESVAATLLRDTHSLLPNLQVLAVVRAAAPVYYWQHGNYEEDVFGNLAQWIEAHPKLKLLLIAAKGDITASDVVLAPRLVPNGDGFSCLPPLNIFIGGDVAQRLRFRQSAAAKIWPISERIPQFLERPDVAEAFEGTWVAEIIMEAAKFNVETWSYDNFLAQAIVYLP